MQYDSNKKIKNLFAINELNNTQWKIRDRKNAIINSSSILRLFSESFKFVHMAGLLTRSVLTPSHLFRNKIIIILNQDSGNGC